MFKVLRQRLAGVLSLGDLTRKSQEYMRLWLASEAEREKAVELRILHKNPDWYRDWWDEHTRDVLPKISSAVTREEQVNALRRETLVFLEGSSRVQPFRLDIMSEEDKRVLLKGLEHDESLESFVQTCLRTYVFCEASTRCLRMLSFELGDARKNDWFAMYNDSFSMFIEHFYKDVIARERDEVYPFSVLMPGVMQMVEDAKKRVLEGQNWEWDKEKWEQERLEKEAVEKAAEPPRARNVSAHQIDELVELVVERWERLRRGELYKVEGRELAKPLNALIIDTGLLLIALSECVSNRATALDATRHIMLGALQRIDPAGCVGKTAADIPLDEQTALLEVWERDRNEGPMATMMPGAMRLLYNVEDRDDKEYSRLIGRLSVQLIDDAWDVIVATKNLFGWKLDRINLTRGQVA